jgi:hypothetical protein
LSSQRGQFYRVIQFNIEDPYGFYADRINAWSIVEMALRAHANTLIVFARDPWGRVFYRDSKVYPRHPNALLDLEELRLLARRRGLNLIIMVCHTANRFIYRRHPEYAQRNRDGEVIVLEHFPTARKVRDPHWPQICPNSPALEEYFVPEAREATGRIRPEGVLLDSFRYMPDPPKACYCSYCRAKFKSEYGVDLPSVMDEEDPAFRLSWEWRYRVTVEAMRRIRDAIKEEKGDTLFLYNSHPVGWAGRGNIVVEKARDILDGVFAEASEFDVVDYSLIVMATKLTRALLGEGKPVFVSRNLFYTLRTTQSTTRIAVKQGVRAIVAAGGHPVATMFSSQFFEDPRALDYLAEVYEELERLEEYLVDVEPISYAAVVFSSETHDKYFWERPDVYLAELEGLTQIIASSHVPVELLSMVDLERKARDYKVLVLPSSAVLSSRDEGVLEGYVGNGGVLVATAEFGVMSPDYTYRHSLALEDIMGVTFEGFLRMGYSYLHLNVSPTIYNEYWSGLPESIVFGDQSIRFEKGRTERILGDLVRVRSVTSKVLALVRAPKAPYGFEYTLGRSTPPPDSTLEKVAGVIMAEHGRGSIIYYSARVGAHYSRLGHPDYAELILRPLNKHAPKPPIKVEAPETIQTEFYRKGDRLVVHLVNHTYNQRILTAPTGPSKQSLPPYIPPYSVHPPRTIIPVNNIILELHSETDEKHTAYNAITGQKLEVVREKGKTIIKLNQINEYALIVIEPRY